MPYQKYRINSLHCVGNQPVGTICYDAKGWDYGLANDDTRMTGIEHVSVTLDPNGEPPTFTIPMKFLDIVKDDPVSKKGPVTQPWVHELTFMQQTVLFGAIRAPDNSPKYSPTKKLLRWYRRCIVRLALNDGMIVTDPYSDVGGSFTGPTFSYVGTVPGDWERAMDSFLNEFFETTDSLPIHFFTHFMHGVEILGYKHPDERIRNWWFDFYIRMVHMLHLFPENEEQLDRRLGDDKTGWIDRADPATIK